MSRIRQQMEPRVFFDQPVLFQAGGSPHEGRALNLSRSGMFVSSDQVFDRGTSLTLAFSLPDTQTISAKASVVRRMEMDTPTERAGMALRFDELEPLSAARIGRFVSDRTRPASGETVRLKLGDLGYPINARTHSAWENVLSVDAELPFLRLGSSVSLPQAQGFNGNIRWVSIHVAPEDGVPRINIGIEMDQLREMDAELFDPESLFGDDDSDPVCTSEFADHAHRLDRQMRASRRAG
jgi:uncharacterized protein (TIGR02266 family)